MTSTVQTPSDGMYQLHCIAVSIYLYSKPQARARVTWEVFSIKLIAYDHSLRTAGSSAEHWNGTRAGYTQVLPALLYDFVRKKEAKSQKNAPSSREEGRRERARKETDFFASSKLSSAPILRSRSIDI